MLYREAEVPRVQKRSALEVRPRESGLPHFAAPAPEEREEEEVLEVVVEADAEWPEGVVPGEIVLQFASNAELERFLREARRKGLTDLEVESVLRTVRLRLKPDQLRLLHAIAGEAKLNYNPFVLSPDVPPMDGGLAARYQPFGDRALEWLGVSGDNADWGRGVKVAILDTGIAPHPSLAHLSPQQVSMLAEAEQGKGVGTHGTAIASLVAGDGEVRGVAPGVDLISIRVLDADGVGDGFSLARGIIAAVDSGAQFINLSLGTPVHSAFLQDAVNYALQQEVAVIASAGNSGEGQILFPARYPGVIGVAAVDAASTHVSFSNRGYELSIAAPGFGVTAADAAGSVFPFNGTSGAAALVTGAAASIYGHDSSLSPVAAAGAILNYANDAGPPGSDGFFGAGVLAMDRVLERHRSGIRDIAVADHYLDLSSGSPEMIITVQNRGTEPLASIFLEVKVEGGKENVLLGRLEAGKVASRTLPLETFFTGGGAAVDIFSSVSIPGIEDARPSNNALQSRVSLDQ